MVKNKIQLNNRRAIRHPSRENNHSCSDDEDREETKVILAAAEK
jgi:hypothetical protein